MIDNEREDYIVLRKDLYNKYGLKRGMIIQLLVNGGGEFIGTIGGMSKIVGVSSYEMVKQNLRELIELGIVEKEQVQGHSYKFYLKNYEKKHEENSVIVTNKKKELPQRLKAHVDAIKKLRNEKYKINE